MFNDRTVLQVIPTLEVGGAERVCINLHSGLERLGVRVKLITLVEAKRATFSAVPEVLGLGGARARNALISLTLQLRSSEAVGVISHLHHGVAVSQIAILLCRLVGRRFRHVAVLHSCIISTRDAYCRTFRGRIAWRLLAYLYRRADVVVCVSSGARDQARATLRLKESQLRLIYNPVIDERSAPFRAAVPGRGCSFAFLGRLEHVKGCDLLLDAFSLARFTSAPRLLVGGDGSMRAELEQMSVDRGISGRVEFCGMVDASSWLEGVSALVVPSRSEALPTVMIEAVARGLPVIAFDCSPGVRELARMYPSIVLVQNGDTASLAKAMEELEVSLSAAGNSADDVLATFGFDVAARKYLEALGASGH
ncbi:glycosyltransferase [Lysobacter sp. GCM10012299]|uniref:glycosyltransferase n=1 Tax=Lysobacter sp. GCM10012299 TaxID=3317333 RepID=UPI00360E315F